MGHDQGRTAGHTPPQRAARPSLERPSLFAGMDGHTKTPPDDAAHVRLLSTLESTRKPARLSPAKARKQREGTAMGWQVKALLGVMGVGVMALLASFVMVVQDGHPTAPKVATAQAVKPAASVSAVASAASPGGTAPGPLASLQAMASPVEGAASQAKAPATEAARIEALLADAPPASAAPSPSASSSAPPTAATGTAKAASKAPTAATPAASAPPIVAKVRPSLATTEARPTARTASRKRDEDVALLEAMFEHTSPRRPPASITEDLHKRCAGLTGPDAATCLAKVCVQHPKAPICHAD